MKSIVSLSWVLIVTFLAVLSLSLEVVAQKPPRYRLVDLGASGNDFAANGNNPLNSVSQPKGALHHCPFPRTPIPET